MTTSGSGTGKTTAQMHAIATFVDWDIIGTTATDYLGYPYPGLDFSNDAASIWIQTHPGYTISYDANNAETGTAPSDQTKTHNVELTLATQGNLEKTGYAFGGWNTEANGSGDSYAAGAIYIKNEAVTLYAQWNLDNTAPVVTSITLTGTTKVGETLTGSYTYSDADSDPEDTNATGSQYQWKRGSTTNAANADNIAGASGATGGTTQAYVLKAADYEQYLFYCVTPRATVGTLQGVEVCSAATAQITRDSEPGDGVPSADGSGTGDGNGDGIPDWQQPHVASLPTIGNLPVGQRWATIAVSEGLTLSGVGNDTAPTGLPRGVRMPLGQFNFTISGLGNGDTTEVQLYVDSSLGINAYFKRNRDTNAWTNIATKVEVVGTKTRITFPLTDGGPFDSDGAANGTIVDPGGPAINIYNPGVPENTTFVGEMAEAFDDTSTLQGVISYSITGGADAAKFAIDPFSGVLRFVEAPDFEAATGGGTTTNDYLVTITASGAISGSVSESIVVSVLDDEGTDGVILNLAGDRSEFTPGGDAEYIDADASGIDDDLVQISGSGNVTGFLLITQNRGTEDGTFSLEGSYGLPGTITQDQELNGTAGNALKYHLDNAPRDDIGLLVNSLMYTAPTSGARDFSVILNAGATSAEAVGFTMVGLDTTAPTLSSVSATATGQTTATLNATANEIAHGYWVALTGIGATAPSAVQVKAGQTSTGTAAVQSGSANMTANVAETFTISGLSAGTGYTLCLMAEDGAENPSTVSCADVTTNSAVSVTAQEPAEGDGSAGSPYEIANLENLYWISQDSGRWNKHYVQTADIDATATASLDGGAGWKPIGNSSDIFTGSYDGGGRTIDGLFINRPTEDYQALFGLTQSSTIKNLGLTNVNIKGNSGVGSLVGYNQGSITNTYATGSVSGVIWVGGLVGMNAGGDASVSLSFATVTVTGSYFSAGGLVGQNGSGGTVSNAYARGSVTGSENVGGLVGLIQGGIVNNVYATGSVSGSGPGPVGGLVANIDGGSVERSFWDTQTTDQANSAGGAGKTTAQMKGSVTFQPFPLKYLLKSSFRLKCCL